MIWVRPNGKVKSAQSGEGVGGEGIETLWCVAVATGSHHHGLDACAVWLRCCATNRKVAGSIPAGVSEFFIHIKSFRSHYGPGVDSASNRNEYQEYFLGVKAAGE